jgi:mannose-1-phosphate guanylyltransferase/phosphomannomutase
LKAVVMAGGEGTRLRPMTANQPKPLLPVANRPIMEHVLRLLKRHGFDETVVTVQFLAALVRNYFGDGEEFGMSLQYATEEMPLGTAGSVRNAEDALRDEPFLVISGDALTDMDLTALVRFHKEKGALVTVGLARVPNPLEFGIVITAEDGQIQRFLEKPTWGQVFSDTVNTGLYVMEPEVLAEVPPGEVVDWSGDVFPKLLKRGAPLFGYISEDYWEDVGTHESYMKAQADVLAGRVHSDIAGFEVSPGIWVAEGAEVDADAVLTGPLCIGDYAKIEAGAHLREYTVIGSNVVVKEGAFLHRAVVHNNVYVGQGVTLRGCVIGKNTDVMRLARIEEGAVVGDECLIEPEAYLSAAVKVYPFKTIEAGAVVNTSVIWESRGQRTLFGPRGVSGLVNVEVTPELAVRLASAYATMLRKGSTVTTSRDVSRAARALKRAVQGALNASAINVVDLEAQPLPVARFETARDHYSGGIALRTTPGDPQSIDIIFLDERGGAGLFPAGVPPGLSRRDRRAQLPAPGGRVVHPRAARVHGYERRARCQPQGGRGLRRRHRVAGAAQPARHHRRGRAHPEQPAGRGVADRDRRAAARRPAAAGRDGVVVQGGLRGQVRPGGRADPARGRERRAGQRGPGAARRARPGRGRAQGRPGGAAGDHDQGGRAGVPFPRRPGELDADLDARAHAGRGATGGHLRGRWSRRFRGA